jgi:hypothetical protein
MKNKLNEIMAPLIALALIAMVVAKTIEKISVLLQ